MPIPGANVFLSRVDASSPLLPDGSRVVTCHPISDLKGGRLFEEGLRIALRLVDLLGV